MNKLAFIDMIIIFGPKSVDGGWLVFFLFFRCCLVEQSFLKFRDNVANWRLWYN